MLKSPHLDDPDQVSAKDIVIFDGHCNFCRSQVERLNWFDRWNRLAFLSLHDPRVAERYADLSYDEMMAQMYVVGDDQRRRGGSDAVRYLSRKMPLLWPAMPILHLPGTAGLWRWLYRQVAQRRYQLAGRTCDEGTCQIHFSKPTK